MHPRGREEVRARGVEHEDAVLVKLARRGTHRSCDVDQPSVSDGPELGLGHGTAWLVRNIDRLPTVVADVRDLVGDDQVVLGVDGGLDLVAHDTGRATIARHRAGVRVCGGHLRILTRLQLFFRFGEFALMRRAPRPRRPGTAGQWHQVGKGSW